MEDAAPIRDLSLYRPNVGVVVFDRLGRVWLGRRAGAPGPHNWQFPQGGVFHAGRLIARRCRLCSQPPEKIYGLSAIRAEAGARA